MSKEEDEDDDVGNLGCAGCGYSAVGCLFWPTLFLFCVITGLGVTVSHHYYHLSVSWDRGLELNVEKVP